LQPLPAPTAEDYAFSRLISYAAYQWPGYRDAPHHRLIARKLEAVERGEITRLMITMPPRHGKSMLASEFFPAWYLGRNPDHYVVSAAYAQELADDFGRKVKNQIEDRTYSAIFPGVTLAGDSRAAKRFHIQDWQGGYEHGLRQNGAFYAVGVGGPLTGRGAHLLLIDDPVKNREEADSELTRKKTKDWYTSTAYTRLMPGGRIVIIQCMVGDTPVLMADGSEKYLRDVQVGDNVATYDRGRLTASKVLNWANQGPDRVYEIRMKSGTTVRANARHPFLVEQDGETRWQRTASLKKGSVILKAIGANGRASHAQQSDAASRPNAKACATRITTNADGLRAFDRLQSILGRVVKRICGIATGSAFRNMSASWESRAAFAPFANCHPQQTCALIGAASSASIIATTARRSGAFSAMTATLRSATARLKRSFSQPLHTFAMEKDAVEAIVDAGVEDVFDIQVANTENFIANGLVSHNTRWHEDDLSGWLLNEHKHEGWEVLDLPAISDDGKALWPEQYDIQALEQIKRAIGPRDWSALYQQRPTPDEGDYFKTEWFKPVHKLPDPKTLRVYGGSDYAVTADGGDYTVHVVIGVDPEDRIYILDLWRKQATSDKWVDAFCDLVLAHKPMGWAEEQGQIRAGVGPFLDKTQRQRKAWVARDQFPTRGDKAVRAQSIRGRAAANSIYYQQDAPWWPDLRSELLSFPAGKHDDQVDALGLVGQLLDRMLSGDKLPASQPNKKPDDYRVSHETVSPGDWQSY
jgi:predicted phage terminase large subunit-like protein